MNMRSKNVWFVIWLLLVIPVWCGATGIVDTTELKVGNKCPDFVFKDVHGKEHFLREFKGKYMFIDVWASWCYPCRKEYPHLKELVKLFEGKNIEFVGVSCDHMEWKWRGEALAMEGTQWWLAGDESFMKAFKVDRIPRFILLDRKGRVMYLEMTRPSAPETERTLRGLKGISVRKTVSKEMKTETLQTGFVFQMPADDSREVVLETCNGGRMKLEFDDMNKAFWEMSLAGGEFGRVWVGDKGYTVWLETGKPWQVKLELNELHFEGAGADVNNYLNMRLYRTLQWREYDLDEGAFRARLQEVAEEREQALMKADLGADFTTREMERIQYEKNYQLAFWVIMGNGKRSVSGEAYSELVRALTENKESWGIFEYSESVRRTLFAFDYLEQKTDAPYTRLLNVLQGAVQYEDERLVEYLVMKNIMEYVRLNGMDGTEEMDRIFRQRVHRPDYVAEYQQVHDANKILFKGQPAVAFTFKDIAGKEVSLSDLKGKYVYIDVWATWCGPCNAEIPSLKELEKRFEGRNICFVSISCDDSRPAWEKFVKAKQLGGIQLHMGGDKSFMESIRCKGIPRFILIDRDGKFVNANMTRPSEVVTLKTLETLPGL